VAAGLAGGVTVIAPDAERIASSQTRQRDTKRELIEGTNGTQRLGDFLIRRSWVQDCRGQPHAARSVLDPTAKAPTISLPGGASSRRTHPWGS
jgi:hypothetical protein